MSKNINVNPGQYKVAGRERPGEDVNAELEKQELARGAAATRRGRGASDSGGGRRSRKKSR